MIHVPPFHSIGLRRWVLLAVLALALDTSAAPVVENARDPIRISLDDALAMAQAGNPRIAVQRAQKARAEGTRLRTRQGFFPRISLDANYLRLDGSAFDQVPVIDPGFPPRFGIGSLGPFDGHVIGIELVQPLINVRAWNARRQAGSALEASELTLDRSRQEVTVAVVQSYYGVGTAQHRVEAERKGLATARRALRRAEAGFDQELVAPVDVLSARTRVAEMEARVAEATAGVVGARSMLRQVLGLEGDAALVLLDSIPPPQSPAADAPITDQTISSRLDLRALEHGVEAAEYGVKRARAAWLPEVSLYARYNRLDGGEPVDFDETGWLLAVNMRWMLFAGFQTVGALGEARATEQETRAKLSALRQQVWAEAQTARAEWEAGVERWRGAVRGVRDAEEALALTEARYVEGLDDMTALLRAQAAELGARARAIDARYDAVIAAERYRLATGQGRPANRNGRR